MYKPEDLRSLGTRMRFCPQCGSENDMVSIYCNKCGSKMEDKLVLIIAFVNLIQGHEKLIWSHHK